MPQFQHAAEASILAVEGISFLTHRFSVSQEGLEKKMQIMGIM